MAQKRKSIKAVIFDMCGVFVPNLWDFWPETLNVPVEKLISALSEDKDLLADAQCGRITAEEFERIATERYRKFHGCPEVTTIGVYTSTQGPYDRCVPFEPMVAAAKAARAAGYKVALLTNNYWIDRDAGKSALYVDPRLFDEVVESCRENMYKPEREIYDLILSRLQVGAEEAIFVDDSGENIRTATRLGMHTIHVTNIEAAARQLLATLGI